MMCPSHGLIGPIRQYGTCHHTRAIQVQFDPLCDPHGCGKTIACEEGDEWRFGLLNSDIAGRANKETLCRFADTNVDSCPRKKGGSIATTRIYDHQLHRYFLIEN